MRTYWNTTKGLRQIGEWEPNCWIQVTCPTEEDQRLLEMNLRFPIISFLTSAIMMSVPVMNTMTAGCS